MGRKKTYVGTSVMRVIEDDQVPDSVRTGVTTAIFRDGNIVDYVLEEMINNIGVKAERMYAYGRDHYVHGLPSGQYTIDAENMDDVVGTVLLAIEDAAIDVDYVRYGPANSLHIGWMGLIASHGYNPATNQLAALTTIKGTPVYLHDMVVMLPAAELETIDPRSLEPWGIAARAGYTPQRTTGTPETRALIAASPAAVDTVSTDEYLRVDYVWMGTAGLEFDSFIIPVTGYDDESDYFHARYRVGGVAKYWIYEDQSGVHPTLDAMFDKDPEPNGTFFPFAYFRYDKVSEIENKTTPSYLTNKKLVKYLGIDYDQVAEAIDENPDIDDVEQAMLILAVPANTTNQLEQRYLWTFFNNLFLASSEGYKYRSEEEATLYAMQVSMDPYQFGTRAPGIIIQDARFKMSLDNIGIYKRRKSGNVCEVGKFNSNSTVSNETYSWEGEGGSGPVTFTMNVPITSHFYQQQISPNFYDEIQVVEMRTVFHIYGKYSAIGDDLDSILLIPLDRSITGDYSIPDKEILYSRSLHFVFNSRVVVKVKWYQTGIFKAVLVIVAIAIFIYTWGGGTPVVVALINAGLYEAAALVILEGILTYIVYSTAFKLFVKVVGVEAAFILAIIAAASGVYLAAQAGSLAGAPFAKTLLSVASNLTTAIGSTLSSNLEDLVSQASAFETYKEEQLKLLETAQDLLDNQTILSPFVIFGEKPEDFYNRTVHSGNIGVIGISAISTYVDQALTLPTLDESLGGSDYVV